MFGLPAVVSERLVGVSHLVRVFALLDGASAALGSFHQLSGEALSHGLLTALAAESDKPSHCEAGASLVANLDGHLVGGTTNAAALDLNAGLHAVEGLTEDLERLFFVALLDDVEGSVEDGLGGGLLATLHEDVREFRDHLVFVFGVRGNGTLLNFAATTHSLLLCALDAVLGAALGAGRLVGV